MACLSGRADSGGGVIAGVDGMAGSPAIEEAGRAGTSHTRPLLYLSDQGPPRTSKLLDHSFLHAAAWLHRFDGAEGQFTRPTRRGWGWIRGCGVKYLAAAWAAKVVHFVACRRLNDLM